MSFKSGANKMSAALLQTSFEASEEESLKDSLGRKPCEFNQ